MKMTAAALCLGGQGRGGPSSSSALLAFLLPPTPCTGPRWRLQQRGQQPLLAAAAAVRARVGVASASALLARLPPAPPAPAPAPAGAWGRVESLRGEDARYVRIGPQALSFLTSPHFLARHSDLLPALGSLGRAVGSRAWRTALALKCRSTHTHTLWLLLSLPCHHQ